MRMLKAVGAFLVAVGCTAGMHLYAQQPMQWNKLTQAERDTWSKGISLLGANGFKTPGNDYRFYAQLDKELEGKSELSTTETSHLKNSILLETALRLKQNEIRESLELTNDEIKAWVETKKDAYNSTESVNLLSIFIRKFDSESSATAKKRAEKALSRIKKGESFGAVAYDMSDARSAVLQGSAGTVLPGKISPELEKIVFSAPVNKLVGPVESARGYYLLKVASKNTTFSLENKKDRDKARKDIEAFKVYEKMAELEKTWREKNKPEVLGEPEDKADWLNQPWIKYGDGKTVPFYYLYFSLVSQQLDMASPGEWNSYFQEEGTIASSNVIQALAASESLDKKTPLEKVAELAVPAYATAAKLRRWYEKQEPTETDLKKFFEKEKSNFPAVVLHDFVAWYTPVDLTTTNGTALNNEGIADRFTETLNQVDKFISGEKTETREDVKKLFAKMRRKFDKSRVTSDTATESAGPLMDPILSRTDVNQLSRPFDAGKEVAVIYMLGKKKSEVPFEQVKESLVDGWRQAKLNDLFIKVKKETGIKE